MAYTLEQLQKESKKTYTAEQLAEMEGRKKTLLDKAAGFFFGGTGQAVGGLITAGIGHATNLVGTATGNQETLKRGDELVAKGREGMTLGNVAAAGLELYPGGSAAGAAVKEGAGNFLRRWGTKSMEDSLQAGTREFKRKSGELAPEMLERSTVVLSPGRTADKAGKAADELGTALDDAYAALGPEVKLKTEPLIAAITAAKEASTMAGGKVVDVTRAAAYDRVIGVIKQYGAEMSPDTARKVRQIFDKGQDFSKAGELEAAVKEARKAAGNAVRAEISKASPEIAKLNAEITFQLALKEIAEDTAERKIGQKGALNLVGGAIAGAGGLAKGGAEAGLLFAAIGAGGMALLTSPAWKSMSAIAKDRIGKMIAEGRFDAAQTLMNRLVAAGISKEEK